MDRLLVCHILCGRRWAESNYSQQQKEKLPVASLCCSVSHIQCRINPCRVSGTTAVATFWNLFCRFVELNCNLSDSDCILGNLGHLGPPAGRGRKQQRSRGMKVKLTDARYDVWCMSTALSHWTMRTALREKTGGSRSALDPDRLRIAGFFSGDAWASETKTSECSWDLRERMPLEPPGELHKEKHARREKHTPWETIAQVKLSAILMQPAKPPPAICRIKIFYSISDGILGSVQIWASYTGSDAELQSEDLLTNCKCTRPENSRAKEGGTGQLQYHSAPPGPSTCARTALTSSTRGSTAGSGNRATVFFITVSLRVWKIFCGGGKRRGNAVEQSTTLKSFAGLIGIDVFLK